MKFRIIISTVLFFGIVFELKAQDLKYPRQVLNTLASTKMQGRGYVHKGDLKAARFIADELKRDSIPAINGSYFQPFSFPMNTFPGKMSLSLDGQKLKAGYDFVLAPESKRKKGTFPLVYLTEAADTVDTVLDSICNVDYSGKFVVADFPKRKIQRENPFHASGVILPGDKIYWWASTGHEEKETTLLMVTDSIMQNNPQTISVNFDSYFYREYLTQNVLGFIEGSDEPDSVIVFSAHYDHLGIMGKGNIFRGANDNASGTTMVLWLTKYFSDPANRPKCSVAFLFFGGEESGLLGSAYFAENPLFPLDKIKALINLDMVGTGSEGITIVNGKKNPRIVEAFKEINENQSFFSDIKIRGEACNSDHCFFDKKGVPAVFIYTQGKEFQEYHNLDDKPEKLPLTKFNELHKMLIQFAETY